MRTTILIFGLMLAIGGEPLAAKGIGLILMSAGLFLLQIKALNDELG